MAKYDCALIIDEDPISCFVTTITLERTKMVSKIHTSRNVLSALNKIREMNKANLICPELIILDLLGNERDYISFLEGFRSMILSNKEKIKLLLLTTGSSRGIEKAKRFHFPYIKKPITEEKLMVEL